MKLVFMHGWGLDASFWDGAASHLLEFQHERLDSGFFGSPVQPSADKTPSILIGHSLGFMRGLQERQDWCCWVAINSFSHFLTIPTAQGCASAATLREMRMRLEANVSKTLHEFHAMIGAQTPKGTPHVAKLRKGLDELRDGDVRSHIETLPVPGLVLASKNDPVVPVAVSEVLAQHQNIEWHVTGGHILPQSDPLWCADHIKKFVKTHANIDA